MPKLSYTPPPPSLLGELDEVAADAAGLAAALAQANRLPEDFPAEQLQELLVELQRLSTGTAEGCRQPLEYARSRLPAIRRQFIRAEQPSDRPYAEQDEPPPLTRGMLIDQRLGLLVNSVTTALDEYRALASIREDDTDTAPSLTIDPAAPDTAAAMAASQQAEQNLGDQVAEVEQIAEPSSETADTLKRQMRDTRGLLHLARIELRMPGFVPRWYGKTIETLSNYPRLLRKTAGAVQMGVDVARPLADAWSHYSHGFKHLVLDSVEMAVNGLKAVADKWAAEQDGIAGPQQITTDATSPPDFDLGEVHAMILRGEAPPVEWRPWIDRLEFIGTDFADLAPIAGLSNLQYLDLFGTQVSDLAPIAGLSALQDIDLWGTQVSDLAPIAGLSALQNLDLSRTPVSDLAPIASLSALQTLRLWGTPVSDLAPIASLSALQMLDLSDTQVSDLASIAGLSALDNLDLSDTQVSDLAPIAGLSALKTLDLSDTQVSDLAPIAGLSALKTLDLSRTLVSDLAPIADVDKLTAVYVEKDRRNFLAATLGARGNNIVLEHPYKESDPKNLYSEQIRLDLTAGGQAAD